MSKPDLNTKTALVTGASRGFGRAAVRALHDRGAKVVGVARNVEQLESLQQELGDGFIPITGNACEPELAERLILKFRSRHPRTQCWSYTNGEPLAGPNLGDV